MGLLQQENTSYRARGRTPELTPMVPLHLLAVVMRTDQYDSLSVLIAANIKFGCMDYEQAQVHARIIY